MAPTTRTSASSDLVEFNFTSSLPIKLNSTNYPIWHKQITHLLEANNLQGYVTGTTQCPDEKVGTGADATPNPAYSLWCRQDHHVSLVLLGSCGPEAQVVMSSATSSLDAWSKLQKAFGNKSRARVMSLKERLNSVTKGTSSAHSSIYNILWFQSYLLVLQETIHSCQIFDRG